MSETSKNKTCAEVGCKVKEFWYKDLPNGRRAVCTHGRHHGEKHIVELLLPEGIFELEPLQSFTESRKFLKVASL